MKEQRMGQWKNGKAHGKGTRIYANGDKYIGDWVDDKRTGNGVYTWAIGGSYACLCSNITGERTSNCFIFNPHTSHSIEERSMGQLKDNKMHGKGTRIYANGTKYTGDWVDDKRTGNGGLHMG